ncbi:hypothetical protein BC939DRAFT_454851 [Gamsiella multidivaricata]|uniref:uncharacterized protein n=1 Tax=Gamsiella multidivaricata TaxID=101098 RepID=UPI002220750B|nr:uncharacterized protein BC939DRAFT_454851 [Gamsiella multidivaricata]KAI7821901.1 hypothetical protein BC939DRAFT_454851 [Gamsiella multidivaricata]
MHTPVFKRSQGVSCFQSILFFSFFFYWCLAAHVGLLYSLNAFIIQCRLFLFDNAMACTQWTIPNYALYANGYLNTSRFHISLQYINDRTVHMLRS